MQTLSHSQAHTQGPWSCVPGKFFIVYSYVDDEPIAVPKTEANAALIAAAPELLEALNTLVQFVADGAKGDHLEGALRTAERAIKKAEGGAA